jgi:hypothetical protein
MNIVLGIGYRIIGGKLLLLGGFGLGVGVSVLLTSRFVVLLYIGIVEGVAGDVGVLHHIALEDYIFGIVAATS